MQPTKLKSLKLEQWRQFENIELEFSDRVTIITGKNGSGKTSIGSVLAKTFSLEWPLKFVSSPELNQDGGVIYKTSANSSVEEISNSRSYIGELAYIGGFTRRITTDIKVDGEYSILIEHASPIHGLYVPAHRPQFRYMKIGTTRLGLQLPEGIYANYQNSYRAEYIPTNTPKVPSNSIIKETLLSWAIFGYGNKVMRPNVQLSELYEGFEAVLRHLLPEHLRFEKLEIRSPEVVLKTEFGEFSLDAVSGGIGSTIELGWQIFINRFFDKVSVVVIDEPENHLHPEMQQQLLPKLLQAFPEIQFVIATHSPLIVTSIEGARIYVLDFGFNGRVRSKLVDSSNAGTVNETLRDILGLPFTMPIWAAAKIQAIVDRRSTEGFSEEIFESLRNELVEVGLEEYAPTAISDLLEEFHKSRSSGDK